MDITQSIEETKAAISLREWKQRVLERQSSGLTVREWCKENGITEGSYYFHLRKVREALLEEKQVVPVSPGKPPASPVSSERIWIETAEIRITLPECVSPEQLQAVVQALKSC